MKRDLFESILSFSFQQKIDAKNWHAEDIFDLSSSSIVGLHLWISANVLHIHSLKTKKQEL